MFKTVSLKAPTPPAGSSADRGAVHMPWWLLVLVVMGLAGLTAIAYVHRPGDGGFALFWPSAGVGLALAVRYRWTGLLATGAGVALWAGVFRDWTLPAALWAALAAMVGPAWVRWRTQRWWIDGAQPYAQLHSLFAILRAQAMGGSVLAATVGTAGLWWTGHWPNGLPAPVVWVGYWMLETCGAWLFAPVATWLVLPPRDGQTQSRASQLWQAAWTHRVGLVFTVLLTLVVVVLLLMGQAPLAQAALYGLLPLLVLLGLRAPPFLIHAMLLGAGALVLFTLAYLKRQPDWAGSDILTLTPIVYLLAGSGVLLVVAASMAERRRSEQRLAHAALIDPLTGLGNEAGLLKRLQDTESKIHAADATEVRLLVSVSLAPSRQRHMEAGLTDFYLLDRDMARRLRSLPTPVWWSRTGLGVFRGVWRGSDDARAAVLDALAGACAQPLAGTGAVPWVVAAALARHPLIGQCPPQAQLGQLMQAEFRAHQFRRLELVHITTETVDALRREAALVERVRQAIDQRTFVLMAQPIAINRTAHYRPTAHPAAPKAEVLVRLPIEDGESGAPLSPGLFLPAAMRAGLMPQLDRAVLEMTLQAMASPDSAPTARCAINLSGPTVVDEQLVPWVAALLTQHSVAARRLVIEVTESMAMTDLNSAAQTLSGLRALGCQVAIDDFGTGMATFDYLKRFPVDTIKIDGSFIQPLMQGEGVDQVIVESMVKVAQSLKLSTVAEYVSSSGLRDAVTALGIDESQGYAVSAPLPLHAWLAQPWTESVPDAQCG
jgi:EAL domain-containing protein (putative c-di-GMP-specific phosphodiesterase class I)